MTIINAKQMTKNNAKQMTVKPNDH